MEGAYELWSSVLAALRERGATLRTTDSLRSALKRAREEARITADEFDRWTAQARALEGSAPGVEGDAWSDEDVTWDT